MGGSRGSEQGQQKKRTINLLTNRHQSSFFFHLRPSASPAATSRLGRHKGCTRPRARQSTRGGRDCFTCHPGRRPASQPANLEKEAGPDFLSEAFLLRLPRHARHSSPNLRACVRASHEERRGGHVPTVEQTNEPSPPGPPIHSMINCFPTFFPFPGAHGVHARQAGAAPPQLGQVTLPSPNPSWHPLACRRMGVGPRRPSPGARTSPGAPNPWRDA